MASSPELRALCAAEVDGEQVEEKLEDRLQQLESHGLG